jgi:hypothetical protein
MRRRVVSTLIASIFLVGGISAWPVVAQTSACQIGPVFLMLRDLIGKDRVGECGGAMIRNEAGDINQPTTRGIMTFRTGDLVAAFSDGQTTWLFGPNGLESRPSGSRLAWETTTTAPITTVASSVPGATGALPPPVVATPTAVVLSTLPIRLDGDDAATTKPIDLTGGDYLIRWEVELQHGKSSCYVGSRLRLYADENPGALVLHTTLSTSKDRSSGGETRLFSVAPGRYVMDVMTTGCDWKFTIEAP